MKTELEAKDLRIGNKVDLYGSIATIQRDDFKGIGIAVDKGKPIPLTEDWFIKFNLDKREILTAFDPYNVYSIRNDFDVFCFMDAAGNCLIYGDCIASEDFFIIKCDTVHEFQNIFKVLVGKELTINETIKA